MPFLDEIAARIVAQGAGVLNQTLFLSTKAVLPINPSAPPFTAIVEYGGMTSRRTQNNSSTQRPSAQLVSRAISYPAARTQAQKVYDALGGDNGLFNIVLSGVFYVSIIPVQQLYDLGLDELQRARVSFNIDVEKYPS